MALTISPRSLGTTTARLANRAQADAATAEHLVEHCRVGGVVRDGCVGILELMAGEDAHDPLVGSDHALRHQQLKARNAGGTGRLAPQSAGSRLGPWR